MARAGCTATLTATLGEVVDPAQRSDDYTVRLRSDLKPAEWRPLVADAAQRICLPEVSSRALAGLKCSAALPRRLACATLAARLTDVPGALAVLEEPVRFVVLTR
ncbi:hypothetical protein ACPFP2_03195 [Micromonospora citrea]|uniref:hypothetical protein n=1 Tax=Micromonospora citrea TaxID=47855 RepID=UPI003C4659F0